MIKEVLLAVSMSYGIGGSTGYASESVTVVKDIDTCKAAVLAYIRSKGTVKDVRQYGEVIEFKKGGIFPDQYVVKCIPIEPPTGHEF